MEDTFNEGAGPSQLSSHARTESQQPGRPIMRCSRPAAPVLGCHGRSGR